MILTTEYDYENYEIHIPVQVRPSPDPDSEPLVFTPPVAIPNCVKQSWMLHWELDPISMEYAKMSGIKKANDYDMPRLTLETVEVTEGRYCRVRATCTADEANCVRLNVFFLAKNSFNAGKPFVHDPTIAVTLDPVDGRSCGAPRADAVLALKD